MGYKRPSDRSSDPAYLRARARCLAPDPLYCHLCGEKIDKSLKWPDPGCATADHVIPIGSGGHNHGTLRPAHNRCNRKKSDKVEGPRTRAPGQHALPW
ncbi:HNH endonuclease [Corynebacterium variabile]|uniref:HNH endonuclease n=1 Tax=Corynebacterium variabile TaxID=1727 RepID=UPI003FD01602